MSPWLYVAAFVGSGILSAIFVQLSIWLAHWSGLTDGPDGGRKTQDRPIPKLGGIAVALAFTLVFLTAVGVSGEITAFQLLSSVLLPALIVAGLGFIDDIRALNPWIRLAFALAGTAAGFLWHNWHPATVYLGDAGAYFLGFLLAIVTLRLRPVGIALPWSALIPVLLVFVPILDTTFVVIRRVLSGKHPFTPGRDHLSHVLMDRGLSVRQAVGALQLILVLSVAGAVALAWSFR